MGLYKSTYCVLEDFFKLENTFTIFVISHRRNRRKSRCNVFVFMEVNIHFQSLNQFHLHIRSFQRIYCFVTRICRVISYSRCKNSRYTAVYCIRNKFLTRYSLYSTEDLRYATKQANLSELIIHFVAIQLLIPF